MSPYTVTNTYTEAQKWWLSSITFAYVFILFFSKILLTPPLNIKLTQILESTWSECPLWDWEFDPSQSYKRLQIWYLMPSCMAPSIKGWIWGKSYILASCPGGVLIHQATSHYRNRRWTPALWAFMTLKCYAWTLKACLVTAITCPSLHIDQFQDMKLMKYRIGTKCRENSMMTVVI